MHLIHRYDINDKVWALLELHLLEQQEQWGGINQDNHCFINSVFWVLQIRKPWRNLPSNYGKRGSVHQRFIRWRRKGIWKKLLKILIDGSDCKRLMIDTSHIKVYLHAVRSYRGQSGYVQGKRGINTKIHLAVDAHGTPVRFFVTSGTTADYIIAVQLIKGFQTVYLLAGWGYNTDVIILKAVDESMIPEHLAASPWTSKRTCRFRHRPETG